MIDYSSDAPLTIAQAIVDGIVTLEEVELNLVGPKRLAVRVAWISLTREARGQASVATGTGVWTKEKKEAHAARLREIWAKKRADGTAARTPKIKSDYLDTKLVMGVGKKINYSTEPRPSIPTPMSVQFELTDCDELTKVITRLESALDCLKKAKELLKVN